MLGSVGEAVRRDKDTAVLWSLISLPTDCMDGGAEYGASAGGGALSLVVFINAYIVITYSYSFPKTMGNTVCSFSDAAGSFLAALPSWKPWI
jgi:hypothetical protein